MDDKFNLSNLPPMKHVDVAEFAANLFEIARADRDDRLKKPDDWLESFNLYSGVDQNKRKQLVNLYFSNINAPCRISQPEIQVVRLWIWMARMTALKKYGPLRSGSGTRKPAKES